MLTSNQLDDGSKVPDDDSSFSASLLHFIPFKCISEAVQSLQAGVAQVAIEWVLVKDRPGCAMKALIEGKQIGQSDEIDESKTSMFLSIASRRQI